MSDLNDGERSKPTAIQLALSRAKFSSNSLLKAEDLKGTTPAAATKALSRLAQQGVFTRVGKGLYFAPRDTILGKSRPSESAIATIKLEGKVRPTGISAANYLGLTTQVPARPQFVAFLSNRPKDTGVAKVSLRRGSRPNSLPLLEGALLEFIRARGIFAETSANECYCRLERLLKEQLKMERLLDLCEVALGEPPRVRAILGAIVAYAELPKSLWEPLKASLNPLTKFEFGLFSELPNADQWQAK
jgi:hypothetical protein